MSTTDYARGEVVRVAKAMIDGSIEIIEGCRAMLHHLYDAGLYDDPDARVIRGVDSETDHLPIGEVRSLWDPTALARKDSEREEYSSRVSSRVLAACHSLLEKSRSNSS